MYINADLEFVDIMRFSKFYGFIDKTVSINVIKILIK